jgi:hypothetical protein
MAEELILKNHDFIGSPDKQRHMISITMNNLGCYYKKIEKP